ncbi:MAG: mechanosensitive ion channel family protein [Chitinophagales bacterium]
MNEKTLEYIILIGGTLLIVSLISFIIRRFLTVVIERNSKKLRINATNFIFIKNSISFILYTFAIIWIFMKIPYFKSLGNTLFAGAGVIAAIIGFASQKAFSNIIGGIFILIFKPFSVGDIIEISNTRKGIIEEITLRHTIIRDFEFRRVVIPNSVISEETIINSSITDDKIRKHIEFGIAYDADVDLAIKIIRKVVENHPLCIDNRTEEEKLAGEPKVLVRVISLGDFSVNLKAYAWANDTIEAFNMQCDVLRAVKKEFDKQGIEIPFPYRTLVFKDKNLLSSKTAADEEKK